MAVAFTLRNVGERTARNIRVTADFAKRGLALVATKGARVDVLRRGQSTSGRFLFRARRVGKNVVFLAGQTSSNHPGDAVTIVVRRR